MAEKIKVLITEEEVDARIRELGEKISKEYQDSHRPVAQTPGVQDEAYQEGSGLSACKNLKI